VVALNKKMVDFIANYPTELGNGHMPGAFPTKVIGDIGAFNLKYGAFKTAKQTGTGTGAKITADNVVFGNTQDLQNDAHIVCIDDAELLKEFMFMAVKKVVSPAGSASLGVSAEQGGTNVMMAGVKFTIQSATGVAMSVTTGADGLGEFPSGLDPDNYKGTVEAEGKDTIHFVKEVNTGVNARLKIIFPAI